MSAAQTIETVYGHIDIRGDDDCWPWTGVVNVQTGYGQTHWPRDGRYVTVGVHRVVWTDAYGPIPDGFVIDHICRNKLCQNPRHMQLLSQPAHGLKSAGELHGVIGDDERCRHGHVGERRRARNGRPYCRACNRERSRAYRARLRNTL